MNPVAYAIQQVKSEIPEIILQEAFFPPQHPSITTPDVITDAIVTKIIQGRVLPDCQIMGGKIKPIPLLEEYYEQLMPDGGNTTFPGGVYRIPPEARDFVDIVAVISVAMNAQYFPGDPIGDCPVAGTTIDTLEHMLMNSHTEASIPQLPLPNLLPGNLIELIPNSQPASGLVLNCRLAYDINMLNLNPSAIMPFGELVVLATKAYIYVNLIVRIEQIAISRGHEVGILRDIVEKYEDANATYSESIQHFRGGATLDQKTKMQLIAMMV